MKLEIYGSENQRLRKENSRLRKEFNKTIRIEEEAIEVEQPLGGKEKKEVCPECGSTDLTTLKFNIKIITACRNCHWRKAA